MKKKKVDFDDLPALMHIKYILCGKKLDYKHIVIDGISIGIVTFFNLSNSINNKKFEKIQITINNQFEENGYFYGSITATGNDNLSTNRKCMICTKNADELSKDKKKEIFENEKRRSYFKML